MLAGRTVGGGLVAGIAASAVAAAQEYAPLAHLGEVGEQFTIALFVGLGDDLRADGDADDKVLATGARPVLAGARNAALRLEMLGVAKVDQRVETGHRLEDDVTALAAVAAVRAAIFDVHLPPEADGTGAAGTRTDIDLGLVEKMHGGALDHFRRGGKRP